MLVHCDVTHKQTALSYTSVTPYDLPLISDVSIFLLQNNSFSILLFGGEYFDGKSDKMRVYNDLYVYHPEKGSWSQIRSPSG